MHTQERPRRRELLRLGGVAKEQLADDRTCNNRQHGDYEQPRNHPPHAHTQARSVQIFFQSVPCNWQGIAKLVLIIWKLEMHIQIRPTTIVPPGSCPTILCQNDLVFGFANNSIDTQYQF